MSCIFEFDFVLVYSYLRKGCPLQMLSSKPETDLTFSPNVQ